MWLLLFVFLIRVVGTTPRATLQFSTKFRITSFLAADGDMIGQQIAVAVVILISVRAGRIGEFIEHVDFELAS
jgi:hypothetical protein